MIYHIDEMPDAAQFVAIWQELAKKEGLPPFLFLGYSDDVTRLTHPSFQLCSSTAVSAKYNIDSLGKNRSIRKASVVLKRVLARLINTPLAKYEFSSIRNRLLIPEFKDENVIPVLYPNWDNTPRREAGALIFHNATPKQFYLHCKEVFSLIKNKQNKLVCLKSWNEWGEGNYMEPCLKYGHGYIEALAKALSELRD